MKKGLLISIPLVVVGLTSLGLITYNQSITNQNYGNKTHILEILEMKENYNVNDMISFLVHEKGFDIRCFSVYAKIYDSSGNKIWEKSQIEECAPGLTKSSFDYEIPFSGIKIDIPGKYQLVVQSREKETMRIFSMSAD